MSEKKFSYELKSSVYLKVDQTKGAKSSKLINCDVVFDTPKTREFSHLKYQNGKPSAAGLRASTTVLLSGIAANIHYGHKQKMWDSAEHLRYVISELERQFVQVAKTEDAIRENKLIIEH